MFRSFLIALIGLTIFVTCTTKKPIVVDSRLFVKPEKVLDSIKSNYSEFPFFSTNKSRVLLDYDLNFRSLKATISAKIDSFTYISLTTSFGQPVAILYSDLSNVYFVDHQEQTVHQISYLNLLKRLNVYLSHRELQNFLFAIPYEDQKTYKAILQQTSYMIIDDTFQIDYPIIFQNDTVIHNYFLSSIYHPQTLFLLERAIKDSRKRDLVVAKYKWTSKNIDNSLPDMSMIEFKYDGIDVEIDFEYKSILFDSLIFFAVDTAYTFKILQ